MQQSIIDTILTEVNWGENHKHTHTHHQPGGCEAQLPTLTGPVRGEEDGTITIANGTTVRLTVGPRPHDTAAILRLALPGLDSVVDKLVAAAHGFARVLMADTRALIVHGCHGG